MTAGLLHRLCARPTLLCWTVGALVVNAIILLVPWDGFRLVGVATDLQGGLLVLLAVAGGTGLGFFAGMFTCWPWIRRLCLKVNGAPFRPSDRVLILSGQHRGMDAVVDEITQGQGGQDVIWVSLRSKCGPDAHAIMEEYALLRCRAAAVAPSLPATLER